DIYYQLEEAIKGMSAACEALGAPVVSGNVSLYNESDGVAIYPTPVVGALGVIDDVALALPMGFVEAGDAVYLIGGGAALLEDADMDTYCLTGAAAALAGSEYIRIAHGLVAGRPSIDLELERGLQDALVEGAARGVFRSAHDCSHGGLAVALAECCLQNGVGF